VSTVSVRGQETGLTLSSAPEFSENGTWPPFATDWVAIQWELFESSECRPTTWVARELVNAQRVLAANHPEVLAKSLCTEDPLCEDFLYDAVFSHSSAAINVTRKSVVIEWALRIEGDGDLAQAGRYERKGRRPSLPAGRELRRVVHAARWRRQDPVLQLPPGATHEVTYSVSTGLTVERCQTLAESLGLGIGGGAVGVQARLSSELKQKFGFRLEITAQEERLRKLTLSNPSDVRYRRFALWHVDHRISIAALDVTVGQEPSGRLHSTWAPRAELEFVTPDEPFVTYVEIDRP